MLTSTRRGISYPNPDRSDRPDIPAHILNLVNALEIDAIFVNGTNAARLAATHMTGVIWYETDTGLLYYDTGSIWVPFGTGLQIDYQQITGNVTGAATTEGGATVIVTGNSVNYDGGRIAIEFFSPQVACPGSTTIAIILLRDTTVLGRVGMMAANNSVPVFQKRFDQPPAGAHVYSAKIYDTSGSGTYTVSAGTGGAGATDPCYIRTVKAS